MKQVLFSLAAFLVCSGFISCKKEGLALFDDESSSNSIYFERVMLAAETATAGEPLFVGFGYFSAARQDSLVKIVVKTTGSFHNTDRPYNLVLSDTSSMQKTTDYEILNTAFAIQAGKLTDTIFLRVKRSAGMKDRKLQLNLDLQPNEHFSNSMLFRGTGTGVNQSAVYYTRLAVRADDIVGIPNFWNPAAGSSVTSAVYPNLGRYSAKKLVLLIDLFGLDTSIILAPGYTMGTSTAVVLGKSFKAYLLEMSAKGTPVLEADGSLMKATL